MILYRIVYNGSGNGSIYSGEKLSISINDLITEEWKRQSIIHQPKNIEYNYFQLLVEFMNFYEGHRKRPFYSNTCNKIGRNITSNPL